MSFKLQAWCTNIQRNEIKMANGRSCQWSGLSVTNSNLPSLSSLCNAWLMWKRVRCSYCLELNSLTNAIDSYLSSPPDMKARLSLLSLEQLPLHSRNVQDPLRGAMYRIPLPNSVPFLNSAAQLKLWAGRM